MNTSHIDSRIPGLDPEELTRLNAAMQQLTEAEKVDFINIYANRRKDPQTILLLNLLGLVGLAGIHRFLTGQIALGIVYFLTAGFCWIGVIVDAINYKKITHNHNQLMMNETLRIMKQG